MTLSFVRTAATESAERYQVMLHIPAKGPSVSAETCERQKPTTYVYFQDGPAVSAETAGSPVLRCFVDSDRRELRSKLLSERFFPNVFFSRSHGRVFAAELMADVLLAIGSCDGS